MTLRGYVFSLILVGLVLGIPVLAALAALPDPGPGGLPAMKRVPQHLMIAEPGAYASPPRIEDGPVRASRPGTRAAGTDVVAVLPIEFTNVGHAPAHTTGFFDTMMNANSGQSVNAFYRENSYGAFGIQATVSGWVQSTRTMENYGADGSGIDDANGPIYRLVVEAVQRADSAGFDFSTFDGNPADGVVDHVVVVHAGAAQESTANGNLIWSHRWAVLDADGGVPGDQRLVADGVQIYGYIMISEDSPFGVVAHEFGHDLGLPDLYDTDRSSLGIGAWDVMASGSWNGNPAGTSPAHFSAWGKVQLGWIIPFEVTTPLLTESIPAVETTSRAYRLTVRDTSNGDEYFLVENRQPLGYDAGLPGFGLLIWHVDDNVVNNDNDAHRLVDLEEADEAGGENPEDPTDPWAASPAGFGPDSNPNSNGYGNLRTGWKVRNISPSADPIVADLSKEVDDDLAVVKILRPPAVDVGDLVDVTATLRNQGARSQAAANVTLRVYRGAFDPANLVPGAGGTLAVSPFPSGTFANRTWQFPAAVEGRYILDVRVDLLADEIPENNERLAHVNARAFYFRDDMGAGPAQWTRPGQSSNDLFRWEIVNDADPYGSSYSPPNAWRFGYYTTLIPNPLPPPFHYLDSDPASVPGGPLYLLYWHQYDLWGRETPIVIDPTETDHAYVEVMVNGGPWTRVAHYQGKDLAWKGVGIDLTSYLPGGATTVQVRFNVSSAIMPQTGGWWVDDVMLSSSNFTYGVAAVPVVIQRTIEPGDEAVFTFKVANLGDYGDTFRFAASVPVGWTAVLVANASTVLSVDQIRVTLPADGEATLQLRVRSPAGVLRGTVAEIPVTVASEGDGNERSSFTAVATISDPLGLGGIQRYLIWLIVGAIGLLVIVVLVDHLKSRKFRGQLR